MPAQVILVRHGETAWPKSGQHTSHTDLPLTGNGEHEAGDLGARLRTLAIDYVWTSPRGRARRMCELAGLSQQAVIDDEPAEWHYGDYEGQRTVDSSRRGRRGTRLSMAARAARRRRRFPRGRIGSSCGFAR